MAKLGETTTYFSLASWLFHKQGWGKVAAVVSFPSIVAAMWPFFIHSRRVVVDVFLLLPSRLLFMTVVAGVTQLPPRYVRNICPTPTPIPRNLEPKRRARRRGGQFIHPCFPIKTERRRHRNLAIWDGMEGICNCATAVGLGRNYSRINPTPPTDGRYGHLASLKLNPCLPARSPSAVRVDT